MVVACSCGARYRVPPEKIGPQGARVRCRECGDIFHVTQPESRPVSTPPTPAPPEPPPPPRPDPTPPPPPPPAGRVVVADSDADAAKRVADYLERRNLLVEVVTAGASALLSVFRSPPDLVLIGESVPGVQAPALTEIFRRSPHLSSVKIVRIATPGRPVAEPGLDAQCTVDPSDLPGALGGVLERFGLGHSPPPAPPPASPAAAPVPAPAAAPAAPPTPAPAPAPAADPAVAEAERLARIIVSDIVLYNQERFDEAAREGRLMEVLEADITEGRALFDARIPKRVRAQCDFLAAELERAASHRLGRG